MGQADDLLDIMRDILLTIKLDNQERFRQMVLETKASLESGLIPGGHGVVDSRLRAAFNEADWLEEQFSGCLVAGISRRRGSHAKDRGGEYQSAE